MPIKRARPGVRREALGRFGIVLLSWTVVAQATTITSYQDGDWEDTSTWLSGTVPGTNDQARISHHVAIRTAADVGLSPGGLDDLPGPYPEREPAVEILAGGSLVLRTNAVLTCRGDLQCRDLLSMEAGAEINFDTTRSTTNSVFYWLMLLDNTDALLWMRGTSDNRCTITSTPTNRAAIAPTSRYLNIPPNFTAAPENPGGGAVDAEFAHFLALGSDTFFAWQYSPTSHTRPVRMVDGLIEQCGRISTLKYAGFGAGTAEFLRTRWINSVRPLGSVVGSSYWGLFATGADAGSTCTVRNCDFDMEAFINQPNGYTIEDNVFRKGLRLALQFTTYTGDLTSFKRNVLHWGEGLNNEAFISSYGTSIEDCILIHDHSHNNPHFMAMGGGTGEAYIRGCLFWFAGPTPGAGIVEGDGPMTGSADSGSRDSNKLIIERCIFMPNSTGPNSTSNLSCNVTSGLMGPTNAQVIIRRNTAFTEGVHFGETGVTESGTIAYVKSNIFYGPSDGSGKKMHDYGHGEDDVIVATNADYNVSYRMIDGDYYVPGTSGKGYSGLTLVQSTAIGANDLDDVDPMFVDAFRNPLTWSTAVGGNGTMSNAWDNLKPTGSYNVQDLLDYIREGFRPRNELLRGAGDPAAGSPDIGAVDFSITIDHGIIVIFK